MIIARLYQPAPLRYTDLCAALERFSSARYRFEPLNRIEGGILCSVRSGVACHDRVGRHMSVRLAWHERLSVHGSGPGTTPSSPPPSPTACTTLSLKPPACPPGPRTNAL